LRTFGVNVSADVAYLAVAEDERIVGLEPYSIKLPGGIEEARRLTVFQEEVSRLLESMSISKVYVLEPETQFTASYRAFVSRITLETLILTAASGRSGRRLSRAKCRSLLNLPRSGSLTSHVSDITPQVGKAWKNKRDLAALAALAGERGE
jgi:hypothetical protein